MNMKLIAPFAAILFGTSACTYVEDGPRVSYQAQFAVGGPLYYADNPVTWHYYDGYTYHLIDHHGRFVGYAYYDYDHFYRIADAFGNIVYFLRWSDTGWRIHDHRNRHLGFINSDNRGNHWIADRGGRRHGGMLGWGNSGNHGHAHAGRHDDRIERREVRRQHDAERDRWRDRKRDIAIRKQQKSAIQSRRIQGVEHRIDDRELWGEQNGRRDDGDRGNNRNRQRSEGVIAAPAPKATRAAPAARRKAAQPRRNRAITAAPRPVPKAPAAAKVKKNNKQGIRKAVQPQRAPAVRQPRRAPPAPAVQQQRRTAPAPVAQQPRAAPKATPRSPVRRPQAAPAAAPRPKQVKPQAAPRPKQVKPKQPQVSTPKPSVKPAAKAKGRKPPKETEDEEDRKEKRFKRDKD